MRLTKEKSSITWLNTRKQQPSLELSQDKGGHGGLQDNQTESTCSIIHTYVGSGACGYTTLHTVKKALLS